MNPFAVALVASYALKNFKNELDIKLFKYPEKLTDSLEKETPHVVCFSNYHWTTNISCEFAKRIKKKFPKTITVFGGPNYPLEKDAQEQFLKNHPEIDFYIFREGEKAFSELLNTLKENKFDVTTIKNKELKIGNCHYKHNDNIICGDLLPRIKDLDEIPSPYLSGMLDEFFDSVLTPCLQVVRGCPFQCLYCQESDKYFNIIARFSKERIKQDLQYIAQRSKVAELMLADSNFAMYPEDLEICEEIVESQKKYNWPKYLHVGTGKNKKELVLKAASILKGNILLGASVQSTDPQVLENIKRQNVEINQLIDIAKEGERYGANSFSETILCLPGDTLNAHFKSNFDMIDAGMNVVRSHQLIMLPGTALANKNVVEKYGMETRFRVYPRCFGKYNLYGETFSSFEIEEICVALNTMSYEEYIECRKLDLTIEIFYNGGVFNELIQVLKNKNVEPSKIIKDVFKIISTTNTLSDIYAGFLKTGEENLWKDEKELKKFLETPEALKKYVTGELGKNEQLNYRALAFFSNMDTLHDIIFDVSRKVLSENNLLNPAEEEYLTELYHFSRLRKRELLSQDAQEVMEFKYDFIHLMNSGFSEKPKRLETPVKLKFSHDTEQKEVINQYLNQYGNSIDGLGLILSRCHINKLYRKVDIDKS